MRLALVALVFALPAAAGCNPVARTISTSVIDQTSGTAYGFEVADPRRGLAARLPSAPAGDGDVSVRIGSTSVRATTDARTGPFFRRGAAAVTSRLRPHVDVDILRPCRSVEPQPSSSATSRAMT